MHIYMKQKKKCIGESRRTAKKLIPINYFKPHLVMINATIARERLHLKDTRGNNTMEANDIRIFTSSFI